MGMVVAFAGKGGTGKTTLAGMLIRFLVQKGKTPVLAVDADSNANLNEVLGLPLPQTLGQAREDMKTGNVPAGMTKDVFISMKMQQAVVEAKGFDLVVMGRPEGPGCYCAANSLLARCLEQLIGNYAYVIIDNEAGMEHISRLTTRHMDHLFIVSDPSRRGLEAALRIYRLAHQLNIEIGKSSLIINQVRGTLPPDHVRDIIGNVNLETAGEVPEDARVLEYDQAGRPTMTLAGDNPAVRAAFSIFSKIPGLAS